MARRKKAATSAHNDSSHNVPITRYLLYFFLLCLLSSSSSLFSVLFMQNLNFELTLKWYCTRNNWRLVFSFTHWEKCDCVANHNAQTNKWNGQTNNTNNSSKHKWHGKKWNGYEKKTNRQTWNCYLLKTRYLYVMISIVAHFLRKLSQ